MSTRCTGHAVTADRDATYLEVDVLALWHGSLDVHFDPIDLLPEVVDDPVPLRKQEIHELALCVDALCPANQGVQLPVIRV